MRVLFRRLSGTMVLASLISYFLPVATAQRLVYRVDLRHAEDHYIVVTVQPLQFRPDTILYQMPTWTPGIYSEVHYGTFIRNFEAFDTAGKALHVKYIKPDTWKISPATAIGEIRYKVEASDKSGLGPSIGLAKIGSNGIVANTEAVFGYIANDKGIPATIVFTTPKDWRIATTLDAASESKLSDDARLRQLVYNVSNYEELVESPLLAAPDLQIASLRDGGVHYHFIETGDTAFPLQEFARHVKTLVRAETSFYGKTPFDNYTFLLDATPGSQGGNAIAHGNSSIYSISANEIEHNPETVDHLVASTFFKTWNGKRFHISPLGPVDYSEPIRAQSLWMTEGLSEYYADMLRVRYGLIKPATFFNAIDHWQTVSGEFDTTSLEGLSLGQKNGDNVSSSVLRARGALAALLLDIEIRTATKNRRSLDNVLLRMNREASTGKTYDDKQLIQIFSKYSGASLDSFYVHYIAGSEPLPVEDQLLKIGAGRNLPEGMGGGLDLALNASGTAIIEAIANPDTMIGDDGPKKGDTIQEINGQKPTLLVLASARVSIAAGEMVRLKVTRNATPVVMSYKSRTKNSGHALIAVAKHPTSKQLAMQKSIIGKRTLQRSANLAENSKQR